MDLNRRETQRQLVRRAEAFVTTPRFFEIGLPEVQTRKSTLVESYDRFVQEQQLVAESAVDQNGLTEQINFAAGVEDAYITALAAMEKRIQELQNAAQPDPLARFYNHRNVQVRHLREAVTFVNSAEFNEQGAAELGIRKRLVAEAYEEFLRENRKIREATNDQAALELAQGVAVTTQEDYLQAYAKLENRIVELNAEQLPRRINFNEQNAQLPRLADFRLESIKVNSFNGDYSKWNEWRALYDSLIHNQTRLSDTEKFHYLRRSLTSAAEQVLSGWHTTGENYQAAYDALVRVYDNSYRIIMAHLDTLHKIPRASLESQEVLRTMIDTTNRVIRQLQVAGSPVDHWDHFVVHLLVSRMPPRTLTQWETSQDLENMPTIEIVLNFLERRARGLLNLGAQSSVQSKSNENSNNRSRTREKQSENYQSSVKCFKCNGSHPIYRCEEVLKKPIAEREKIIKNLKLCRNCFRKDHETGSSQCRAGKCRVCQKENHNSILCPKSKGNTVASLGINHEASSSGVQQNFH